MCRRVAFLGLSLVLSIVAAILLPAAAGTISVRWDPVSDPQLAGYRLYHGPSSGVYDQTLDVGNTTSATLTGLADCAIRYVAVKALAQDGSESALYSAEIAGWPRPTIGAASPSVVTRGSQASLTLTGSSFRPGSSVRFSDPAISVLDTFDQGCGQLTVQLDVGAAAAIGPVDVTVVHADNVFGTAAGLLTIDPGPPSISAISTLAVGDTEATIGWTTDTASDSRVGFRPVGGSVWQSSPVDSALVTQHSVTLTGLQPQTEYEYTVHSEDAGGRSTSAPGPAPFTTLSGPYRYLRIEAEALPVTSPLAVVQRGDAFAGAFVELDPAAGPGSVGAPSGQWSLSILVPYTGSWSLWARLSGDDASSDGWQERMDGGSWAAILPGSGGPWHWAAAPTRDLTGGLHTWTLGGLDPGARLDRILLTDDPSFQPTESPGGDVTPPAPATSPSATAGDANVQLSWNNPSDPGPIRVVIRYRTDGIPPGHPADGMPWLDRPAIAGAADGATHSGLSNGVTYSYGIFLIDNADNASPPAVAEGTPESPVNNPPSVDNLRRIDVLGG